MLLAFATHRDTSSTGSHPPPVQGLAFGQTIGEVLRRHDGMPPMKSKRKALGPCIIDPVDEVHLVNDGTYSKLFVHVCCVFSLSIWHFAILRMNQECATPTAAAPLTNRCLHPWLLWSFMKALVECGSNSSYSVRRTLIKKSKSSPNLTMFNEFCPLCSVSTK